jgi:hypothetical protein
VTRSGRPPRGVAALFGADPYGAVVRVVREADSAITATDIKHVLEEAGVPRPEKRTWDRLQKRLRVDDHVIVEPHYRYRWTATPVAPSVIDAFERIVRAAGGRVSRAHIEAVRHALACADGPAFTDDPEVLETAARRRQMVIDGLRALAELASEVEELSANEASGRAMIHRVRSRVKLSGLEPIERAGETAAFDRRRHELIGPPARDGATVLVVRPGYAWRTPHEDVIVARAVVQE